MNGELTLFGIVIPNIVTWSIAGGIAWLAGISIGDALTRRALRRLRRRR